MDEYTLLYSFPQTLLDAINDTCCMWKKIFFTLSTVNIKRSIVELNNVSKVRQLD